MLVSSKKLFRHAFSNEYAIGAFNTNNLETTKAIISAAEEKKSPVFVQTTHKTIAYAGLEEIAGIVKILAIKAKVPVALHLDHGKDLNTVAECVKNGYTSLMFDGSALPYSENVDNTKKTVALAKSKKIGVEAELGVLKSMEKKSSKELLTDPVEALNFVKSTKVDALAVAIGTSHGAFKFKKSPKLDFVRLSQITTLLDSPLTLHGASSVPAKIVKIANKYGAKLKSTQGVPENLQKKAIPYGIVKINVDTDLRIAFDAGIRKALALEPKNIDSRHLLSHASEMIKDLVMHKMEVYGCADRG